MNVIPTTDVDPRADAELDLREDVAPFEFRLVKQRFAQTFQKLDVIGRPRGWYVDNLLLAIAVAGPDRASEVAEQSGYRFVEGPTFEKLDRGRIEVWGRLAPIRVIRIPEPSQPSEPIDPVRSA